MIGDFIFALSTFPIKIGLELWEKRFGFDPAYYYSTGILDTETEVETETTTDVSSEPPPPPGPHTQRASPNRKPDEVTFPRKGVRRPTSNGTQAHQPIASSSRTRPKQDIEPNFYATSSTSASASSTPPQQQRQKLKGRQQHEVWYPPPSAYAGDDERLQDSRTTTTTASFIELDVQVTSEKQQKLEDAEEWRQYPAFPSAYPPTPLVTTSRLVSTRGGIRTTTTTNMYPIINERDLKDAEEWRRYPAFPAAYPPTPLVVSGARLHGVGSHPSVVQEEEGEEDEEGKEREERENNGPEEDFRGSLQPLREPLNPGSASDSSDSYRSSYGIQNHLASSISALPAADISSDSDEDTEIYSDVEEEEEEQDNFNITLQTPLHHPLVVPIPRNQRPVSLTSTLASASTGLTTVHDGSLRTRSSGSGSGSGGGEDDEMDEEGEKEKENAASSTSFTMPSSSSVLGKKRALQGQGETRRAKGTESPHGHGRKSGTKKRRVSTSQSPTRQQGAAFTTDEEGNVQVSTASERRDAERARTPTPTNTNTKTKSGGRSRRRRTPLSPSRVNAPRSPLRVNTPRSPLRVNTPRSPSRVNTAPSPSRVNAPTTRAVRPRVTRYATPPPPLLPTLGSVGIGAMTTALESTATAPELLTTGIGTTAPESTTTAPESMTTGTGTTTTENWTLVAPRRPDPILIPDKQTRRGSRPQVPTAQRSSRRLRSGESAAQARKPDSAGDPPPEQRKRRTTVNVRTATTARTNKIPTLTSGDHRKPRGLR